MYVPVRQGLALHVSFYGSHRPRFQREAAVHYGESPGDAVAYARNLFHSGISYAL